MSLVDQRIEEWKRKIVDLSRRNRLLFFSRTRGSTLRVAEPSLTEVFERLVNSEEPWEFYMPPDAPDETKTSEDELGVTQLQPDEVQVNPEPEEFGARAGSADRNSDELLTDIEDGKKLRNILRNLYRRSRTDFEERGVRILFLTFGVLEWKEVEQSEIIKSPILLVPVELTDSRFRGCAASGVQQIPSRPRGDRPRTAREVHSRGGMRRRFIPFLRHGTGP
jgi:hypothetical protein